MPFALVFIPLLAALLGGQLLEKEQQDLAIPVGVVDQDKTEYSKRILSSLKEHNRLKIYELSRNEAEESIYKGELDSVFVIKKQFQKKLLSEKYQNTIELWKTKASLTKGIVQEIVAAEVTRASTAVKASNQVVSILENKTIQKTKHAIWEESFHHTQQQWEPEPLMTIKFVPHHQDKNTVIDVSTKNTSLYVPYLGIWSFFTMVLCFLSVDWILKERSILFPRISTTELGLNSYLLQSIGAHLVLQVLQLVISFVVLANLGYLDGVYVLVSMLIYVLFSTFLGVLTASFTKNMGSFYIIGFLLPFSITFLGENFIPLSEFFSPIKYLNTYMPQHILWESQWNIELSNAYIKSVVGMLLMTFLFWKLAGWRLKTT